MWQKNASKRWMIYILCASLLLGSVGELGVCSAYGSSVSDNSVSEAAAEATIPDAVDADATAATDVDAEDGVTLQDSEASACLVGLTPGVDYVAGEILLLMEEDATEVGLCADSLQTDPEIAIADATNIAEEFVLLALTDADDMAEALDYYGDLEGVVCAQPNYILYTEATSADDTQRSYQWYWSYLGMDTCLSYVALGSSTVRVGVIDTGVDTTHEDLQLSVNTTLSKKTYSGAEGEAVTKDVSRDGHGTHVSGIIGATTANQLGIAGLGCNTVDLVVYQASSSGNGMSTAAVIQGIAYAIEDQVRILNMSFGMTSTTSNEALEAAIAQAADAGILMFASAGNNGTDTVHYPSGYDTVYGVIATTEDGTRRTNASYGESNFISAPGEAIYSTIPTKYYTSGATTSGYGYLNGASMSTAVVSGVAACILAVNPALTNEQVITILALTATDTYTTGFDGESGYGVLDAAAAIQLATGFVFTTDTGTMSDGEYVEFLYATILGRASDKKGLAYWKKQLKKGLSRQDVAVYFVSSKEFSKKYTKKSSYVAALYRTLLGREGESVGLRYWVRTLSSKKRSYVIKCFARSKEFLRLTS